MEDRLKTVHPIMVVPPQTDHQVIVLQKTALQ
jgi:hypothetical protein